MKRLTYSFAWIALLIAFMASTGWSQTKHIFPIRSHTPPPFGAVQAAAPASGNGIIYHGGPLMLGTINVYYIWYGNWSGAAALSAVNVLQNLATNIGGSAWFNINSTYSDASGNAVANSVHFAGSTFDNYSQGKSFGDSGISSIVSLAISSGQLPNDTNGVYFVLTSSDVDETSGFCNVYCGWHNYASMPGGNIKFAFVGDPSACLADCADQTTSPNGVPGADAMASVIAHELSEAATDPVLSGWWDSTGMENADKCAWTFGTTYRASNNTSANVNLGGLDYLIQQNWVNASGGYCALSFALPGPTLTKIAPTSGLQGAAVPVTLTGTGFSPNSTVNVTGSGVSVSNVVVVNTTQITATFNIDSAATVGAHSVTVIAATGTTLSLNFSVTTLVPTLTSISPSSGAPGVNVGVTLTGTNFVTPVQFNISGSGVTPSNVSVVSGTQITATFSIDSGAALGGRTVSVTTANGTSGTVNFAVAQPTPTLTSINPSSAALSSNTPVTLTGTNFVSPATLNIAASGVTASNVTVVNSTQITANFSVASTATTGGHNVSVSTANGTSGAVTFTVNPPTGGGGGGSGAPSISSISPSVGKVGTTVKVTFTGKYLNSLASIPIQITGSGVTFTSVTPVGTAGTSMTANFVIASNAAKGTRFVSVKNTTGVSNTVQFTIQ